MKKIVIIEDVHCWMDGGTITLKMKENESLFYDVEFVQKVSLTKAQTYRQVLPHIRDEGAPRKSPEQPSRPHANAHSTRNRG